MSKFLLDFLFADSFDRGFKQAMVFMAFGLLHRSCAIIFFYFYSSFVWPPSRLLATRIEYATPFVCFKYRFQAALDSLQFFSLLSSGGGVRDDDEAWFSSRCFGGMLDC